MEWTGPMMRPPGWGMRPPAMPGWVPFGGGLPGGWLPPMAGFGAGGWPAPGMGGPWGHFGLGAGPGAGPGPSVGLSPGPGASHGPGPGAGHGPGAGPGTGWSRSPDWAAEEWRAPAPGYIFPEALLPGFLTICLMAASVPESIEPASLASQPDVIEVLAGPPAFLAPESDAAVQADATQTDLQFLPAASGDGMSLWAEGPVELLADEPVDHMNEGEA